MFLLVLIEGEQVFIDDLDNLYEESYVCIFLRRRYLMFFF